MHAGVAERRTQRLGETARAFDSRLLQHAEAAASRFSTSDEVAFREVRRLVRRWKWLSMAFTKMAGRRIVSQR